MSSVFNPALAAFKEWIASERIFGQVWIRRTEGGFELRHEADRAAEAGRLRLIAAADLIAVAERTATGEYRPLKSAPNLQRGWRTPAAERELDLALQYLYPGAMADWYAATRGAPPTTDFQEFTRRQSGMYRITAQLDATQAARTVRAGCPPQFCLKRRLWSAGSLGPDAAEEKSAIPCLEPCPLLLEFARKSMRIEQEKPVSPELAPSDWAAICAAMESPAELPAGASREAEFNDPRNPRRRERAWLRLKEIGAAALARGGGED